MQLGNILQAATEPVAPWPVKFKVLVSGPGGRPLRGGSGSP